MALVRVHSPDTEPELMTVVAMLEAHDIRCFVHSAGFGSLYPGPQINGYNSRSIWVLEEKVPAALELIRDFQSQPLEP
jgi:Putative prokaryotic signal transducing protein